MNKENLILLIAGGSPAGLEAAISARNACPEAQITLVAEDEFFACSFPGSFNYLAGDISDFKQLVKTVYGKEKTAEFFKVNNNIEVLTGYSLLNLKPAEKLLICQENKTGLERSFHYDRLLLAMDEKSKRIGLPGEDLPGVEHYLRPQSALALVEALQQGKIERVAIIGGNANDLRLCEAFKALWGIEVHLFTRDNSILTDLMDDDIVPIVKKELEKNGINLHLQTEIKAIIKNEDKLDLESGSGEELPPFDRVILTGSYEPGWGIIKQAGIKLGPAGGISVDEHFRTTVENIYAVGPAVETMDPSTGKGHFFWDGLSQMLAGKIAGENLALKTRPMIPLFNNRILKIFDLQIGSIGLRENKAQANNTQYRVVRGLFSDKAHYLPEVNLVSAKMLFSPAEGRILGFQAASKGSIIQYLDTVSGLMKYKGTVFDLAELEPANTPALADIDYPFHFLANYAISLLKNGAQGISPLEFGERAKSSLVLDVREDYEVADKPLRIQAKAMLHIPSASVKKRLSEIPPGFPVIAVCGRGSRSCNIANLLKRSGIKEAYYVSGGLSFWQ